MPFGLSWGSIASGVASGVGFALGGPVGSAVLGGAAGAISAAVEGKSMTQIFENGVLDAATGFIPGGLVGGGLKDGLMKAIPDLTSSVLSKFGKGALGNMLQGAALSDVRSVALSGISRKGLGSLAAGAGTALSDNFYNLASPKATADAKPISTLPTVSIGNVKLDSFTVGGKSIPSAAAAS